MSARSQGLPVKVVANADNGAETAKDEWTLLLSKKGSPIKEPADLAGKTIAVNALKGVGEVEIKAALDKRGVDPNSIKLLEIPFPEMPAALDKPDVDVRLGRRRSSRCSSCSCSGSSWCRSGSISETSIPPASAAIPELFTQLAEASLW